MNIRSRSAIVDDEKLLDALLVRLAPLVAAELARRDALPVYSTEPGLWPPGVRTVRAARSRIRKVPGHERIGAGVWQVARVVYLAHYTRRPVRAPAAPTQVVRDEEIAARALEAAGLRSTKEVA